MDTSTNLIGEKNFQLVMELVKEVFHSFSLGKGMRYGLAVFGDSFKVRYFDIELLCSLYVFDINLIWLPYHPLDRHW